MTKKQQRIIGIDPGFGRVGWGIIEGYGTQWTHVAHGCIETTSKQPFIKRLIEIDAALSDICVQYQPTLGAIEELFFYKNVTTAIDVGHARGVILLALAEQNMPLYEYTPLQIKQAITGYGRADKAQIQTMVQMQLALKKKIRPDDAADALAVALTCGTSFSLDQKIKMCG